MRFLQGRVAQVSRCSRPGDFMIDQVPADFLGSKITCRNLILLTFCQSKKILPRYYEKPLYHPHLFPRTDRHSWSSSQGARDRTGDAVPGHREKRHGRAAPPAGAAVACPTHSRGSNEWVPRVTALRYVPSQTGTICPRYFRGMTRGLERWYGGPDLHFITCSCYRRRPELGSGERRDLFLRVLERARQKYRFVVIGYVVMPEHFHLLITEPELGNPSVVMKVVKERFTKLLHRQPTHPNTADEWGTRHPCCHGPDLAKAFLRLQCVQYGKAHREATLHASEPGEARSGRKTRRVEMEQFPDLCLRRRGLGERELSGMAAQDNVFRLAVPLIRTPRMSGAPRPEKQIPRRLKSARDDKNKKPTMA